MKFVLNCTECGTKEKKQYQFDTETHMLYSDGVPILNNEWQMRRTLVEGKKVRLLMGTKCNLNCSYCSQEKTDIDYRYEDCANVVDVLNKVDGKISVIEFWGGEPLAYFKYIQRMVEEIRKHGIFDDAQFAIITNGYLLTDKIVNFLIRYKFRIQISYDGYTQKFRSDFDYFALKVPLIKRLLDDPYMDSHRSVIFATVLLCGQDLFKAQEYFVRHFGRTVNLQPIPLLYMKEDLLKNQLSEDQQRLIFAQTYLLCVQDGDECLYSCQTQANEFACSILHGKSQEASRPCVTADDKDIVLDIKGNFFLCQNRAKQKDIIGNVFNGDDIMKKRDMFVHYDFCDECILKWFCHGACRILKDECFVATCRSYFYYYLAMFCAAVYKITGAVVTDIENLSLPVWEDGQIKIKKHSHFKVLDLDVV